MDERKKELKALKKANKKTKRRKVALWKTFAILFLVFAVLLSAGSVIVSMFDNALGAFMGGSFWEVENEDTNAIYFAEDFATDEERIAYGADICYQVEAEGAVLLMNNGALPLAAGSKVSTVSTSSVNIVYGGTGSGNVDASKADSLKAALEKSGMEVNPTLWDFYTIGEGAAYSRDYGEGESAALLGSFNIGEAPWSVYTQSVKDSIATYGDAAIVTISRIGGAHLLGIPFPLFCATVHLDFTSITLLRFSNEMGRLVAPQVIYMGDAKHIEGLDKQDSTYGV